MPLTSPNLWVVATPLGNLGDFSPRAQEVLQSADIVLAEDTRRAGKLFSSTGTTVKKLISFHDHNEGSKAPSIIEAMQEGQIVALVSDAGMPVFSDPGFRLVRLAREADLHVSVVPGPSAPLTALAASGIAPQPFTFLGFPPRKKNDQERFFGEFQRVKTTLVFFERKNRLPETLEVAHKILGNREVCIARELTKTHEEFILMRLDEYAATPSDLLGEITVIVGPPEENVRVDEKTIETLILEETAHGGKPREIARRVKERVNGWGTKEIYQLMQNL